MLLQPLNLLNCTKLRGNSIIAYTFLNARKIWLIFGLFKLLYRHRSLFCRAFEQALWFKELTGLAPIALWNLLRLTISLNYSLLLGLWAKKNFTQVLRTRLVQDSTASVQDMTLILLQQICLYVLLNDSHMLFNSWYFRSLGARPPISLQFFDEATLSRVHTSCFILLPNWCDVLRDFAWHIACRAKRIFIRKLSDRLASWHFQQWKRDIIHSVEFLVFHPPMIRAALWDVITETWVRLARSFWRHICRIRHTCLRRDVVLIIIRHVHWSFYYDRWLAAGNRWRSFLIGDLLIWTGLLRLLILQITCEVFVRLWRASGILDALVALIRVFTALTADA